MEEGARVETDVISGHMVGTYTIDKSFWPRAWRLFQETEDWLVVERDVRASTCDRLSWDMARRRDGRSLDPALQKALHDSLMQAKQG